MSSGLLTLISRAYARNDHSEVRRFISTGFAAFGLITLLAVAAVISLTSWSGVSELLGVARSDTFAADARALVGICCGLFSLSFLYQGTASTCSGLQESHLNGYAWMGANLLQIAGLAFLWSRGASLVEFALVVSAPPLVANGFLTAYIFGVRHRPLRPTLAAWNSGILRSIMTYGGWLFIMQIGTVGIFFSNNLMIANRLGPRHVPEYAVPWSAFYVFHGFASLLVAPYLAAYSEAATRRDWHWIHQTYIKRLRIVMVLTGVGGLLLVAFGQIAIRAWAGLVPGHKLLMGLAAQFVLMAVAEANGVLLIALGRVKLKGLLQASVAIIYVVLAWQLFPSQGLLALPIAGIAAHAIEVAVSLRVVRQALSI
jgi:O-antigen/teichoic acid export membrane protein